LVNQIGKPVWKTNKLTQINQKYENITPKKKG